MKNTCSLFPYLPGCDHLNAAHADEFERLNRAIRSKGGFRLLLVQYNLPQYRNNLLNRLACLYENSRLLKVEKESCSDFGQLQARMEELAENAEVIHVTELEYWSVDAEKEWLPALNYQREPLARACPLPVVLWLPGRLIKLLALHAPDVWAWRAGVFDFSVKAEIDAPHHIKNDTAFLNTDERQRRQQRIRELETYLAEKTELVEDLRASLLGELGELYETLGQPDDALKCFKEALEFYKFSDQKKNVADTMSFIADIYEARGELDEALRIWQEESLPVYEQLGDVRSRAVIMGKIADIYKARGELDKALSILKEKLLPAFERVGDVSNRAVAIGYIADIYEARGELEEALRIRQEEELPVYERLGNVRERAVTMGKIAYIYQARGELDEALRIRQEEVLPAFQKFGDPRLQAVEKGKIADIYQARGELDEALRIWQEEELPVYERLGDVRSLLITQAQIGIVYLQLNPPKTKEANRLFCQALSAARQMNIPEAETIQNILKQNNMTCDEV